jgi:hypothetical protein
LIDANVLSESRKRGRANSGVIDFFERATLTGQMLYFAAVSLGELRRGFKIIQIAAIALVNNQPWATSIFPSRLRSSKCRRAAGSSVFVLER